MECNKWGRWQMKFTFFCFSLDLVFWDSDNMKAWGSIFWNQRSMNEHWSFFYGKTINIWSLNEFFIEQYSIVFWEMKFSNLTRLGSTSTGKNLVLARIQNLIFLKFFYPLKIFYDQKNFWTWLKNNFIASDFRKKNQ